jgi:hypothetical protein
MRTQSATIPLADIHFDAADIDEKAAASYFRQMSHKKKPARPSLHIERGQRLSVLQRGRRQFAGGIREARRQ